MTDAHRADMERGSDRLILSGKKVARAPGPGCPCCKDTDEALARHGARRLGEGVDAIATEAELSLDGEARRCARVKDPLKRAQAIADVIAAGKVRRGMVGAFRATVARYVGTPDRDDAADAAGAALTFDELIAWPDPVEGDELLDEMAAAVHRHAHCTEEDATIGCLWVAHSERRRLGNVGTLARLIITAGREDSGKTHFALALFNMMEKAEHTISPRPANIYRAIEQHGCAFFLDEADDWYPKDLGMREIINAGFNRRGSGVLRCEDVGQGGKSKQESRRHSTFTPLVIIGLNLPGVLARTVVSRCLTIRMRPARAGDEVEDLFDNQPAVEALRVLARKLKRWIDDNETALVAAQPERPDGVINRLWITWRPLLAIADLAGGDWPRRARKALEAARSRAADPGLGIQLLVDMRAIIAVGPEGPNGPRMPTADVIAGLLKIEERVWQFYGKAQRTIRDTDIAALVEPYEVRSAQFKHRGKNLRGYHLCDIEAALTRYAPSFIFLTGEKARYPRYPATEGDKPNSDNGLEGSGKVAGVAGQPATSPAADAPNGADAEAERGIAEIAAGRRCASCAGTFGDEASELIDDRRYHPGDCAGRAKPKRKRRRIKGGDMTPDIEEVSK